MLRGWLSLLCAAAAVSCAAPALHTYQGVHYAVFDAVPAQVKLLWQDSRGKNYASLRKAADALKTQGKTPLMLMNAGIFGTDGKPAGLWIENGKTLHPLNTKKGKGNFHIQPNGIFWILGGKAYVEPAQVWLRGIKKADYAVQSGPMLLINGRINPHFVKNLRSPYKRNAVCVTQSGGLKFIITADYDSSGEWPSFYRLAEALQHFGCYNALYLDGAISAYYAPSENSGFHWKPFVGIIAVLQN